MKFTIHSKIVFVQATSLLSILFLLMLFNNNIIQKEFLASEVRKVEIIAETISGLISTSIEIELFESAIDVIKNTHTNNPNIIKTEILTLNDKKLIKVENTRTNKAKKKLLITKKIYNSVNTSAIAIMKIYYSSYEYEELTNRHNKIFLLLLSIVTFFIILSIYLGNKLLSPFYNLANKLMNFDPENNNQIIVSTNLNDEVGIIQNAIYEAVERMKNYSNELKQLNLNLDTMVKIRTNELQKSQEKLKKLNESLEKEIEEALKKQRKQQDLIIQQSKLAAMGEMIGNIAHQWRQPLAELSGILMNIEGESEFGELTSEYLNKKIIEADEIIEYMSNTIEDFRNFFKSDREKEVFKFKDACESAISIVKPSLKFNNISFEFNIINNLSGVGYPHAYSQVILNIISNAKDILIDRKIKNPKITMTLSKNKNKSIVSISDNGGGVKVTPIEKIFEPYFSTKHSAQGTGIGLYMSKMIIEKNMNGKLGVKNREDGAQFQIII